MFGLTHTTLKQRDLQREVPAGRHFCCSIQSERKRKARSANAHALILVHGKTPTEGR